MTIPTDEELLTAIKSLKVKEPTLGRAKVLKHLKEGGWQLSDKRLKACIDTNGLSIKPAFKPRDEAFHEVVKAAYDEYTKGERDFWLELPEIELKKLRESRESVTSHWRHHAEFLFTLKGIKPCMAIEMPQHRALCTRLVTEVLRPIVEKYSLKSYGFELNQVTTHVFSFGGWAEAWIFADVTSPLWLEVQVIFLGPTELLKSRGYAKKPLAYNDMLGRLFGYPVRYPRCKNENDIQWATFADETEKKIIKRHFKMDICCVNATKLQDDVGDQNSWLKVLDYFDECRKALASVGSEMGINLYKHPALEQFYLQRLLAGKH